MNEQVVGEIEPEEQWIGAAQEPPQRRQRPESKPYVSSWGRGLLWGLAIGAAALLLIG